MNAAQLVQDHWTFMQRITNDDDEAQQLALRVLEKFEQFNPERSTFGQFIKLKLRELRQHYSDKGVVDHPCRKESGGYVSLDEVQASDNEGDDEEVGVGLYNLIAASLPPPNVPRQFIGLYYEWTKSRRPAHCETVNSLGRCPEPVKLKPRVKRLSREAFRRELVAQVADAPRMKARIYYAERAAGKKSLPKDRLWQKQAPDSHLKQKLEAIKHRSPIMTWRRWIELMKSNRPAWLYEWRRVFTALHGAVDFFEPKDGDQSWSFSGDAAKSKIKRRAGHSWHRLDGKDEWEGLAYLRAYLARNGLALRLPPRRRKRRSPFLTWLRRAETDEHSVTRAIGKENTDLLWAALRGLCYKRAWPPGIPPKKIAPEDEFSPRERLLRQAKAVLLAAGLKVPVRRPLRLTRQHTETTPYLLPRP